MKQDKNSGKKPSANKFSKPSFSKNRPFNKFEKKRKGDPLPKKDNKDIRLNKFLSNAGICSRREADVLIKSGVVEVNGKVITSLGYKINPGDQVKYDGGVIKSETKRYVLLNKPKNFSVNPSAQNRSVYSLIAKACKENIGAVGKMDRNTTGLLLFTNDSDLAKKLLHPQSKIKELYHLVTDKPVKGSHLKEIREGVNIGGKLVKAEKCEYVSAAKEKTEIGVEMIFSKKNFLPLIFEALGYRIVKCDRVTFAGLTKKDVPRGEWKHLDKKEIDFLKML